MPREKKKPGRLSTLCLLLGWHLPARWGAGGSVVPHISISIYLPVVNVLYVLQTALYRR